MSQHTRDAPDPIPDRWADPAVRHRGLMNVITSSAVIFAVPGVATGTVVAAVVRRTEPVGPGPRRPHPARTAAVGAATGGLTGALFGVTLGAVFAVFDTVIRRYLSPRRPTARPPGTGEATVTDTGVPDIAPGHD